MVLGGSESIGRMGLCGVPNERLPRAPQGQGQITWTVRWFGWVSYWDKGISGRHFVRGQPVTINNESGANILWNNNNGNGDLVFMQWECCLYLLKETCT